MARGWSTWPARKKASSTQKREGFEGDITADCPREDRAKLFTEMQDRRTREKNRQIYTGKVFAGCKENLKRVIEPWNRLFIRVLQTPFLEVSKTG